MSERPVVIDASVAIAIVLREPRAEAAVRTIRDWSKSRRDRVVPKHDDRAGPVEDSGNAASGRFPNGFEFAHSLVGQGLPS